MSDIRSQIFDTLNQKSTDELLEIWKSNDRSKWSSISFVVIQDILRSRHVELLPQDLSGFVNDLENGGNPTTRLESAKVLAKSGDDRGLDYLIHALESDDKDASLTAERILSEINIPKGVLALHSHLLKNNRTIYFREDETTDNDKVKRPYILGYLGFVICFFLIGLVVEVFPLPACLTLGLELVAGYFIFKYVVQFLVLRS